MFNIIALIICIMILAGGLYYFWQEKEDQESRKIYMIVSLIGLIATIIFIIRII